jgi:hypothetical protein
MLFILPYAAEGRAGDQDHAVNLVKAVGGHD